VAMATFWRTLYIMMEKSAQPGEGARPAPFTITIITYKVVV
jgi:hypothetical protein